jgi:hypothetical protein
MVFYLDQIALIQKAFELVPLYLNGPFNLCMVPQELKIDNAKTIIAIDIFFIIT